VEDAGASEIVISAPHEPAPKTDAPFDCAAVMTRISSVFPMRFIYAKVDFQERFGLSASQYAALLKDPRCSTIKVEVGGHADERGSDDFNEDLAERRANRVRDMLVEAGVAADRLTVASYGESMPLSPAHDEEGWSVNRRVEIKIVK
jgi:peptidoglycan-associated lipoprotein